MVLRLQNLSKHFFGPEGKVRALNRVSLTVAAGENVVVQGVSGSGKTTLLLIAGSLLEPTEGDVLIDGEDPYSLNPNQRSMLRADKIGFVFQRFHLVPYLSVLDNVLVPSVARFQPDAASRARELIQSLNMEHRINHVPSQLSTGERQRTALARALLNRPRLILADEPTGNLDEHNSKTVLEALSDFSKDGGSVLIVTHDPEAAIYAGRRLHMDSGQLLEEEKL